MPKAKIGFVLLIFSVIFFACKNEFKSKSANKKQKKQELLIYCENAIAPPIYEIKKQFERDFNCKVTIQNDCVQNLIGLINYSNKGDIFIPSSIHAFNVLRKKTAEHLIDSVFLGYNSLVFMVHKGNPKKFNGDFSRLASDDYAVIIANPETSSLGYETRIILEKWKIYDDVLNHVIALTADSKGLIKSIKDKKADVVINFASTIYINGSRDFIDQIPFKKDHFYEIRVYAGILSTCSNTKLARTFMDYINNSYGTTVLNKYGFSKRKSLIF